MKLPQSDIKTSCEKCIFARFDRSKQIGCRANRLSKFEELNKAVLHTDLEGRQWFLLKRFCNMYRNKEQQLEDARKQITTTFGIVIYDNDTISNLDSTIESIKQVNYDKTKLKVVISSSHKAQAYSLFHHINDLKSSGINAELVINLNDLTESRYQVDKDAFIKCVSCAYLVKLNHGNIMPIDFLEKIDISLNDKLETITIYEHENIISLPLWLANNNYLNYNNFDLMCEDLKKTAILHNMYKKL